jgi:hypothetical protein
MEKAMSYFRDTADASRLYYANADASGGNQSTTAVPGNLADFVKNTTVYRVMQPMADIHYYREQLGTDATATNRKG